MSTATEWLSYINHKGDVHETDKMEVPLKDLREILEKAIGFERVLQVDNGTLFNRDSLLELISKMDNS